MSRKLRRILVHVPTAFLEEFDKEISRLYASRNEAIRSGMVMVIEAQKRNQEEKHPTNTTPTKTKKQPK